MVTRVVPSTKEVEHRLLERARIYDINALAALYDHYEPRIFSYIYHRVGNHLLAQDLTSQVFLRVLEAIQHKRAWEISFSAWLYRIAHNLVADHYRQRQRASQVLLDDLPPIASHDESPHHAAERALTEDDLRIAINRLTDEQAQVITLRFLEGLSISEVAEIMGKTEGAVKTMQYRAVLSLRRMLEEHQ